MWEISVIGQTSAFLYSAVLGVLLGLFYDIIRAIRKAGANSFAAVFAGDIIFWLLSAVAVFIFLVAVTNGEIRGYVLISCFSGFALYILTAGKIICPALAAVFIFTLRIIRALSRKVAAVCAFIEKLPRRAAHAARRPLKQVLRAIKKLLKNCRDLLYTKKNSKEESGGDEQKG